MQADDVIHVAGHRGLVGGAVVRALQRCGFRRVVVATHAEVDLTDAAAVDRLYAEQRPAYVFMAAARVGGIKANGDRPAEFIRDNLAIQTNVIHAAWKHGVRKLLFLGSSCIYPRDCPQPIREDCLMTGPLEPSNAPYAIAKIAGVEMCRAYRRQYGFDAISAMPTNVFGIGDNFDADTAHVLSALIRRFDQARRTRADSVRIWGTGRAQREFIDADELADALLFLMREYSNERPINVGSGAEFSIMELATLVAEVVGYQGRIETDPRMPDGTPRKRLDVSRLAALGWTSRMDFRAAVQATYDWYLTQRD
jgi:GDP-L-fucose synthase